MSYLRLEGGGSGDRRLTKASRRRQRDLRQEPGHDRRGCELGACHEGRRRPVDAGHKIVVNQMWTSTGTGR